jgi:hypothetical protein
MEKKGTINLGSFDDKESLLSKAIIRIDENSEDKYLRNLTCMV